MPIIEGAAVLGGPTLASHPPHRLPQPSISHRLSQAVTLPVRIRSDRTAHIVRFKFVHNIR